MSTRLPRRARKQAEAIVPSTPDSELSRQLLRAQEEERKRISRELHDETGQGLMLLRLYLGMLESEFRQPETQLKIQQATELLDRTIEGLRRIIARLSPRVLDELGLVSAIRREVRDVSKNTGMKGHADLPEGSLDAAHEIEVAIYRSVQEALHNVAKHSRARNFRVRLWQEDRSICLVIQDDGVGFSKQKGSRGRGFGLLGMRERIAVLGGNVRINSGKGAGTHLRVTLPLVQAGPGRKQKPQAKVVPFVNEIAAGQAS